MGDGALENNVTGNANTAVGHYALRNDTVGGANSAFGVSALGGFGLGYYNVAVGYRAGLSTNGSSNVLIQSEGLAGESNVLRIGHGTGVSGRFLDKVFVHGIQGRTVADGSGATVFVDGNSRLGTKSCGTYVPASICPLGNNSNGPACDAVPPGSFCESDGECGTNGSLDNCGIAEWYLRTD